ncbi:hypothetical protein N0V90_003612 [Kalmusia sp. IMI 367209]|nr:hypothetical protein N0V90_003612 [Kalmusia sp. IMI 367209]
MSTPSSFFGNGLARFMPRSSNDRRPGFARPLPQPSSSTARLSSSATATPATSRATQHGLGLGKGKGKGKGGVGLGNRIHMKRHKKIQKDTIQGITKGDIRRLARRGGVKRISATVYDDIRTALKERLKTILDKTFPLVEMTGRKTITVRDIIFTLNTLGTPIYGFDASFNGRHR